MDRGLASGIRCLRGTPHGASGIYLTSDGGLVLIRNDGKRWGAAWSTDRRARILGADAPSEMGVRDRTRAVLQALEHGFLQRDFAIRDQLILTDERVQSYSFIVRYSLEHKAQNRENILSVAARSFREHGGDSSGIGTVMKKSGLTKGGFYRHFRSKDDLFVEAVARALDETGRGMVEVARSAPEGQALRAIIERYLSVGHANSPGSGCVRAALGPELARKPLSVRKRIEALLEAYRERLSPFMPGQTREEKLAKCRLLFPSMAGVLMMVRVIPDPQKREQRLMEARNFFIKCFAEE